MITEDDEWSRIEREIKRRAAQEPSRTTLRQAAQQALNAIHLWHWAGETHLLMAAHDVLCTALEQPEQEPVAWFSQSGALYRTRFHAVANGEQLLTPLYTTPPAAQRPWQGLTKEDIFEIAERLGLADVAWADLMLAVEAALKKRNT